ncbi:MAG TPA: DMT family transporter, partial [Anaerolineales bacterium]|nr:DMT family transporter [Anaerolineales bacterium]
MKIDAEQGCRSNLFRILFFKSGKICSYNPAMAEENTQPTSDTVGGGRVAVALLTAILAVSAASIFIRFAQAEAPSLVIAALRLVFATLLLAPIAWTRYRTELRSLGGGEIALGIISGLFLAAHFATWITSLEYTTVASSVVIVCTGPLWVALLSPLLLNERLKKAAIVGLAVAILGGAMIGLSEACVWNGGLQCSDLGQVLRGDAMWGNFLALVGAWTVSGYLIIGRKLRAARNISLIPYIFMVYGVAAVALIIAMFAAGQSPLGHPAQTYGWILLLAVFPQLIGHSTYNWALRYLPASFVAVTTLGEPIGSAILAFFLLKETPTIIVISGGILILSGIYLASKSS